uniref:Col_cuticle_N domain-containing protein n=1 Tax=Heterorhabditis bacteriophora TaxID=37862 RepID=A0A1I7XF43_HETBA
MSEKCAPFLNRSANVAIFLSGIAFLALTVSMPVLFTIINNIEEELIETRVNYEEMSNMMWKDLVDQGDETRRVRRQACWPSLFIYSY